MPAVLVRDVGKATLARIDAVAQRTGVSRNLPLRELLAHYAHEQESGALTDEQVDAFGSSVGDLFDEGIRCGSAPSPTLEVRSVRAACEVAHRTSCDVRSCWGGMRDDCRYARPRELRRD